MLTNVSPRLQKHRSTIKPLPAAGVKGGTLPGPGIRNGMAEQEHTVQGLLQITTGASAAITTIHQETVAGVTKATIMARVTDTSSASTVPAVAIAVFTTAVITGMKAMAPPVIPAIQTVSTIILPKAEVAHKAGMEMNDGTMMMRITTAEGIRTTGTETIATGKPRQKLLRWQ